MRKMTFAIDVDDVCLDLCGEWLSRYRAYSGDELYPEELDGWDMGAQVMVNWSEGIYGILREPDLYERVQPVPGAKEAIARIRAEGHNVLFVSACVIGSVDQKMQRLVDTGFGTTLEIENEFCGVRQKDRILADVLIDDRVKNVEEFPGLALLVTVPHNRNETTTRTRIAGLHEALEATYVALGARFALP